MIDYRLLKDNSWRLLIQLFDFLYETLSFFVLNFEILYGVARIYVLKFIKKYKILFLNTLYFTYSCISYFLFQIALYTFLDFNGFY